MNQMTITSKEHYDVMAQFEAEFTGLRLDKEQKELWKRGYARGIAVARMNAA